MLFIVPYCRFQKRWQYSMHTQNVNDVIIQLIYSDRRSIESKSKLLHVRYNKLTQAFPPSI